MMAAFDKEDFKLKHVSCRLPSSLKCFRITLISSTNASPWLKKILKMNVRQWSRITHFINISFTMVEENFENTHLRMVQSGPQFD